MYFIVLRIFNVFLYFFGLLFFLFFLVKFSADTYRSIMVLTQINFSIKSENKHIFVKNIKNTQFALTLYTKSWFVAIFGPLCMYKIFCNFGTAPPGITNFVLMCAGNSKEKLTEVPWTEVCAWRNYCEKCLNHRHTQDFTIGFTLECPVRHNIVPYVTNLNLIM